MAAGATVIRCLWHLAPDFVYDALCPLLQMGRWLPAAISQTIVISCRRIRPMIWCFRRFSATAELFDSMGGARGVTGATVPRAFAFPPSCPRRNVGFGKVPSARHFIHTQRFPLPPVPWLLPPRYPLTSTFWRCPWPRINSGNGLPWRQPHDYYTGYITRWPIGFKASCICKCPRMASIGRGPVDVHLCSIKSKLDGIF